MQGENKFEGPVPEHLYGKPFGSMCHIYANSTSSDKELEEAIDKIVSWAEMVANVSRSGLGEGKDGKCVFMIHQDDSFSTGDVVKRSEYLAIVRTWANMIVEYVHQRPRLDYVHEENDRFPDMRTNCYIEVSCVRGYCNVKLALKHDSLELSALIFGETVNDHNKALFLKKADECERVNTEPEDSDDEECGSTLKLNIDYGDLKMREGPLIAEVTKVSRAHSLDMELDRRLMMYVLDLMLAILDDEYTPNGDSLALLASYCHFQTVKMRSLKLKVETERWLRYQAEITRLIGGDVFANIFSEGADDLREERLEEARRNRTVFEDAFSKVPDKIESFRTMLKPMFEDLLEDNRHFWEAMIAEGIKRNEKPEVLNKFRSMLELLD